MEDGIREATASMYGGVLSVLGGMILFILVFHFNVGGSDTVRVRKLNLNLSNSSRV